MVDPTSQLSTVPGTSCNVALGDASLFATSVLVSTDAEAGDCSWLQPMSATDINAPKASTSILLIIQSSISFSQSRYATGIAPKHLISEILAR
jgi:hypothetical protein